MTQIAASIDVDVPVRFADREWSEFVWRTFIGHLSMPVDELKHAVGADETNADQGVVRFETKDNRLTRVAVELNYSPRTEDAAAEEAQVRSRLLHDLELFRAFLLQRCDETSCRTEWREA
jgi:hypothetical protein